MDFIRVKEDIFFIRLDRGENVNETLKAFCKEHEIHCGRIKAIGALENVELGYYDYHADTYTKKVFEQEHELLSMDGNISLMDSEVFVHLHVVLSNKEFQAIGGHMFEGRVAVTVECYLEVFEADFNRLKGSKEKFRPISF